MVIDFETTASTSAVDATGVRLNYLRQLSPRGTGVVAQARRNVITIAFNSGTRVETHSDFLTAVRAGGARLALPLFDQPIERPQNVTLEHPINGESAANGAELSRRESATRPGTSRTQRADLLWLHAGDFKTKRRT